MGSMAAVPVRPAAHARPSRVPGGRGRCGRGRCCSSSEFCRPTKPGQRPGSADGNDVSFLFLWKTYWIGGFISLFLPTSYGGDVYRVYAVRHASQSIERGTSSVLFDRITGLFALVSIAAVSSLFMPENEFVWVVLP